MVIAICGNLALDPQRVVAVQYIKELEETYITLDNKDRWTVAQCNETEFLNIRTKINRKCKELRKNP